MFFFSKIQRETRKERETRKREKKKREKRKEKEEKKKKREKEKERKRKRKKREKEKKPQTRQALKHAQNQPPFYAKNDSKNTPNYHKTPFCDIATPNCFATTIEVKR